MSVATGPTDPVITTGVAATPTGADERPPFSRVVAVELRKMVNTRSGFWVPIGVALLTFIVALIATLHHGGERGTVAHVFHIASMPCAFLLPIIGVLLVAGEWSQRTTLTTFTLVSSRTRVLAAKASACVVVSLIAMLVTLLFAFVLSHLFGNAPGGAGSISAALILQGWVYFAVSMLVGLAFGAAFLMSAPAIVAYLLLPVIWNGILGGFSSLQGLANWLDTGNTLAPLTQYSLSPHEWAQALVSVAFWFGIPMLIGLYRIGRGDLD